MIINVCGRNIKPRTQCQILLATTFLTLLAIAVPLFSIMNTKYSTLKSTNYKHADIDPLNTPKNFNGAVIWANITIIDTAKFQVKTRFSIQPVGDYASQIGQGLAVFKNQVEFTTQRKKSKFDDNDILASVEATYPIVLGDPNLYPFDRYASEFVINLKDSEKTPIPIAFGIVAAVQAWNVYIEVTQLPQQNLKIEILASRGWIIKFFSSVFLINEFVLFTMWVLSLTILTLSATIWFRERKVEPPIIGLCASLMFALPALRNIQPGAPGIFD